MDPLSITTSAATLAHVLHSIFIYGRAAYKSKAEQKQLKKVFDMLDVKLKQLEKQEAKALKNPEDPMYQGFLAVLKSSEPIQNNENPVPDPTGRQARALQQLQADMQKREAKLMTQRGFQAKYRRLLWHHSKRRFEETIEEIEDWTRVVDSILIPDIIEDTNERVRGVHDKIDVVGIKLDDAARNETKKALEKRRKALEKTRIAILAWLSPLEFRQRQAGLLIGIQGNLSQPTLLTSEEFKLWKEGRPWILYCQGKPGAGKTVACAAVIQDLTTSFEEQNRDIPVLCMYLNHKERGIQSLDNLIASLLKQLIQWEGAEFKSEQAKRLYQVVENESRPTLDKFFEALCAEIEFHERVIIVVDALDEAPPSITARLLERLHTLARSNASIMITSQRTEDGPRTTLQKECDICRNHPIKVYFRCTICNGGHFYICQSCRSKGAFCDDEGHELTEPPEVVYDIEPSQDAVKVYVQSQLEAEMELGHTSEPGNNFVSTFGTTPLGRLMRSQPSLKDEILKSVVAKADGMYALAGLYMNSLRSLGLNEAEILEMLARPPEGYSGFYEQHMERISAVNLSDPFGHAASLGKRVLSWVVHTKRPLSLSELQDALTIDLKKPGVFNPAASYDKATIVSVTAGLITIDNNGTNGNEAVRLNHQTAQQYFYENRDKWFPNASAEITRVSLHYLSLEKLSKPCENEGEDKEFDLRKVHYPFLEYAYEHWGEHAAQAGSDTAVEAAVMKFVSDTGRIAASIQAMWYVKSDAPADWDIRKGANALHICAWFGLTHAVSSLLDQGVNVNSRDPKYAQTALMYACRRGHSATVTTLLDRGADVNVYSHRGSCAILEAVCMNHIEVLKVLLARPKTNVNAPHFSRSEMAPLMFSSQGGNIELVNALLDHQKLDVNQKDLNGDTALFHAIQAGHTNVIKSILGREDKDLNLNAINWKGSSALILAATLGRDGVVYALLSKGADSSIGDKEGGGTALLRAIDGGHLSTVKSMLDQTVDINCVDNQGCGLLHGAAVSGNEESHKEILQLLLAKGLDPNARDKKGNTALHHASRLGHWKLIQILLDNGAKFWLKNKDDRTPWTVAWQNGHTTVLKVLGRKDPYELTEQDLSGEYTNASELPIWSLALLGQKNLVAQALLTRRNEMFFLDPDNSNTALHCAVLSNEVEIASMLLEAGMSVDAQNDYFRTPLHIAAIGGDIEIMKLLLKRNDQGRGYIYEDTVNCRDKWGSTPLIMAYSNAHYECALLLIEAGATIPASKQPMKQSLFFFAIEFGRLQAVIYLVNMGADVQAKNVLGLPGLQLACDCGKEDIETYLRKNKSVWVNRIDSTDRMKEEEMVASLTLKESPFHRPEVWEEEEGEGGEKDEKREANGVIVPEGATQGIHLQQLNGLNVPTHARGPDEAFTGSEGTDTVEARVPQQA